MRLGLIARADSRGLGIQTKNVYDNLHPAKVMVVDCQSAKPLPLRPDWFPGATWVKGLPTARDFRTWLDGVDCVYTAETGYGTALWDEAERAGVRTVLHANFEFLNPADRPTVWAAPSTWRLEDFPQGAVHLPVPIDTTRFPVRSLPDTAQHFVHLIGRPAVIHQGRVHTERAGTVDLLKALAFIQSRVTVTIRCQEPGYVNSLVREHNIRTPGNVTFVVDSGDVADNASMYEQGHVMVLPRRFGGLSLPTLEAVGSGWPCIMPDISPNNDWLASEWLVPARHQGSFMAKQRVEFFGVSPQELAAKIDQFASDTGFYLKARTKALELREQNSWERLLPKYREVLGNV